MSKKHTKHSVEEVGPIKTENLISSRLPVDQTRIPNIFLADGLSTLSPEKIIPPVVEDSIGTFSLDRWLFGQYNKLLPLKANCRALVRLAVGKKEGIALDISTNQIAQAASILGDYLVNHDNRHNIGRDDALATAFPRSNAEKSYSRYANQFVGYVNTQNILSGLMSDYRLVGLVHGKGSSLLPTEQAIHFARLPNPVLDNLQTHPKEKFSSEEVKFLIKHITLFVPVENFAFLTLINAICNGANSPKKLEEALNSIVPSDPTRSLSPSFLTSQRSGAISRMVDIGLVSRLRLGSRVSYEVTELGHDFRIIGRKNGGE